MDTSTRTVLITGADKSLGYEGRAAWARRLPASFA